MRFSKVHIGVAPHCFINRPCPTPLLLPVFPPVPVLVLPPCIQCQGVQSNWKLILRKKGPVFSSEQAGGERLGMPLAAVCYQTGLPVWRKPQPSSLATQEYYLDLNNF